ncbi:condensation domain-containing protein, partial [Flavitalea flava]
MMEIKEFLEHLKSLNFSLVNEHDKLILQGDEKKLTEKEIGSMRENQEIISYIKKNKNALLEYLAKAPPAGRAGNVISIYRLSALQQGMLFHGLYDGQAGSYVEQISCSLPKPDTEILKKSWEYIVQRHTILRSGFYYDAFNIPVQCVYRNVFIPIEILDFRDVSENDREAVINAFDEADRKRGFDFTKAPLMRIALMRLGEDSYRMLWTHHHILLDGWSLPILLEELLQVYEILLAGSEPVQVEEDKFEDYIRIIERRDKDQEQEYWERYFSGVDAGTLLPFIGPITDRNKGLGEYKEVVLQLDGEEAREITAFAQRHRITINTLMQGVWAFLLYRYTGSGSVVYGVTVSGRPEDLARVERRVGMYINTLPLLARIEPDQEIVDWLQELQESQSGSREHQHAALNDIQRWVGITGDFFDSLLVFENYPMSKIIASRPWALKVENVGVKEQANYPLSLTITAGDEVQLRLGYNTRLLEEDQVVRIRGHFKQVLQEMVSLVAGTQLKDLQMLPFVERSALLGYSRGLAGGVARAIRPFSLLGCLSSRIGEGGDRIAVVHRGRGLSYGELNRRIEALSDYLRETKGLQAGERVVVLLDRSEWLVVAVLSLLRTGLVYVPVDPAYPAERIRYILEQSEPSLVITEGVYSGMV